MKEKINSGKGFWYALDALVRQSPQGSMDTRPRDDRRHLANTLSDYFIQLQLYFFKVFRQEIPRSASLPFSINLIANLAFTPILFGVRSLVFAPFDIVVVLVTLFWGMGMIWRYCRWVAITTTLQLAIMQMNVVSP